MKRGFHGKKKLCGFLFTALLTMAVLGGCADGTGESSGDNSSVESGEIPLDSGSEQESTGGTDGETSAEESASGESTAEAGQAGDAGEPVRRLHCCRNTTGYRQS